MKGSYGGVSLRVALFGDNSIVLADLGRKRGLGCWLPVICFLSLGLHHRSAKAQGSAVRPFG